MVNYWVGIHKRLHENDVGDSEDAWRYRKYTDTGCKKDPEWEQGRYSACHDSDNLREDAAIGDWIFDVVCPNSATGLRVIRSAFKIASKQQDTLKFESYFFLEGDWEEGIVLTPRRGAHEVENKRGDEWVRIIRNLHTYTQYRAGEKPDSHSENKWDEMVARTPSD